MNDHAIYSLCITVAASLLAYVILWSGLQTFNANPTQRFMRIWPKLALYYAAYTMPGWALLLLVTWVYQLTPLVAGMSWQMLAVWLILLWVYFFTVIVQPNRLRLNHQAIDLGLSSPVTVAVLADLRIGLYSGKPRHIRKVVATINALTADAVLITGDWLYYPGADLVGQLMLFKGVNKPIYTVMSTSDLRYQSMNTTKQGEPLLEDTLACAFDVLDITYIGQQCWPLPPSAVTTNLSAAQMRRVKKTKQVAMLCGWQDMPQQYPMAHTQTVQSTPNSAKAYTDDVIVTADKAALSAHIKQATWPVIILASRFDSITDLPHGLQPRPLLIAGAAKSAAPDTLAPHKTQAQGDVRRTLFSRFNSSANKRGLHQHGSAQVFVSSGIGTRGTPFRIYRPTVDVLTIR